MAPEPGDLERENVGLVRKLARLDANVREMEGMYDATSKLLSKLTQELDEERLRSHELLLNILPQPIIDRLEAGETNIADHFPQVTVLFSDLVGFTAISSNLDARTLVTELNRLFSRFDDLCAQMGVEKIKTIGDAYLVACGLPGTATDHVVAVADLALAMVDVVEETDWKIRIGVHTGPVVAGVIGARKFAYDVWGDTVNLASRLETSSEPNRVHVSEAVAGQLQGMFAFERRGAVDLKGKGATTTYFLVRRA